MGPGPLGKIAVEVVFHSIAPVFGVVLIGWLAGRSGIFGCAGVEGLTLFVFNFALPCMLLRAVSHIQLLAVPPWGFLVAYFAGAFTVYGLGMWLARGAYRRPLAQQGVLGFGCSYSNIVLLGIPLVLAAFGDAGAAPLYTLVAVHSVIMFPIVTIIIELGAGGGGRLAAAARGVARNPIVLALLVGAALNFSGVALPMLLDGSLELIGRAAPATALFALGAALSRFRLVGVSSIVLATAAIKTLLMPALVWVLARFVFDVAPLWREVALVIAAMPTGVNMYVFAERYKVGVDEAAATVLLSTLLSVLSLSLVLWVAHSA